jgi:hypothetical protein
MKNYKFKYADQDGENEYKVFFDVATNHVNKEECSLEIDGEIYLENYDGEEIEFKTLSKTDQSEILELVESWIEREQMENGCNYYQDSVDGLSDYYYDGDR